MFRYGWAQRVCICSVQVLMGKLIFMDCAPKNYGGFQAHGAPPFLQTFLYNCLYFIYIITDMDIAVTYNFGTNGDLRINHSENLYTITFVK